MFLLHINPSPHSSARQEDTDVSSGAKASQTCACLQARLLRSPTEGCQQHEICISHFLFLQAGGAEMGRTKLRTYHSLFLS